MYCDPPILRARSVIDLTTGPLPLHLELYKQFSANPSSDAIGLWIYIADLDRKFNEKMVLREGMLQIWKQLEESIATF